jgi:hypothetical protein
VKLSDFGEEEESDDDTVVVMVNGVCRPVVSCVYLPFITSKPCLRSGDGERKRGTHGVEENS